MLKYNQIKLLPDTMEICWFISILTCLLYSENLRKIVLKTIKGETSENPFLKRLKYIIKHNYKNPEKLEELFKKDFNTVFLLYDYINYYHKINIKTTLKSLLNSHFSHAYFTYIGLIQLMTDLNINYIDLFYYDNKLYRQGLSYEYSNKIKKLEKSPKILILFHQDIHKKSEMFKFYTELRKRSMIVSKDNYSGIEKYEKEIQIIKVFIIYFY